jgi:hypothetical protein
MSGTRLQDAWSPRTRRNPSRWKNHEDGTRTGGVAALVRGAAASVVVLEWTVAVDGKPSRGERRRGETVNPRRGRELRALRPFRVEPRRWGEVRNPASTSRK